MALKGKVECNGHPKHEMIEITPNLWMCECTATGSVTELVGAAEEARAMVARAGGFEALREQHAAKRKERLKLQREERESRREKQGQFGHYQPVSTPGPP